MVTTRRRSKQLEQPPALPLALPPAAPPKRKRSNDSAPSAAQPPNQPSTKRRKRVKSTAKVDTPPVPSEAAPPAPAAVKRGKPRNAVHLDNKPRKHRARSFAQPKANDTNRYGPQQSAPMDLTNDNDDSDDNDDLSENDTSRRPQPAASQDADDEDVDSRYTLGSKSKDAPKKNAISKARRTAELNYEEDGLEEVDKAKIAVANASTRTLPLNEGPGSAPWTPINSVTKLGKVKAQQANGRGADLAYKRNLPPSNVPCKIVMYTIAEAIAALLLYRDGTMSAPAEIDTVSRQPYEALQTGEYLSYPVKGTYHLGALGRYGIDALSPTPFSLTVPLSEHCFIQTTPDTSTAEPSRAGLGFSSTLPNRPKGPLVRRPNNYCFTFGKYRGRRMDSVPVEYLRSIYNSDDYHNDAKLQQAFADLYPKGLYESDAESYTFEKGGFKGKRLDEVPKSYLWGLLRKKTDGGEVGGKKGRGRLERALEVWEKGQLDLTKD